LFFAFIFVFVFVFGFILRRRYGFMVDIINELGTSGVQNAPVLKLFQSCHKMVERVERRIDNWKQRSSADIEASDGQGYNYGLRMLFAFARVVQSSLQASENDCSQMQRSLSNLQQRNRIALNRCRCKACQHLAKIKKHHFASLPLWLCEEYALTKPGEHNNLPHEVQERKIELLRLFSDKLIDVEMEKVDGTFDHTTLLYCASLFCFWPHCKNYEIRKIKIKIPKSPKESPHGVTNVDECRAYVSKFLKEHNDDDRFQFIVSIHCDSKFENSSDSKKDLIEGAKIFVVVTMRCSAEANKDGLRDMRWLSVTDSKEIKLPSMMVDNQEFEFLKQLKPLEQDDVKLKARIFVSCGVYDDKECKAYECFHEMAVNQESSPGVGGGGGGGGAAAAAAAAASPPPTPPPPTPSTMTAVALAESDDSWNIDKFLYLLNFIKLFRDDFGKEVQDDSDHDKNDAPLFFKFNFCSNDMIKEWLEKNKYSRINGFNLADLQKQASRCVQCLWDQSIAFMNDLPSVLREANIRQEDKDRYEACRDTIAVFTDKIKIVETTTSDADSGIKNVLLQR
jgi:hypothetical protein